MVERTNCEYAHFLTSLTLQDRVRLRPYEPRGLRDPNRQADAEPLSHPLPRMQRHLAECLD